MTRDTFAFTAPDLSAFARALSRSLAAEAAKPGHQQMLNHIARAAGYRNYQHFRAQAAAATRLDTPARAEQVDHAVVERAARHFDAAGQLVRWPSKPALQGLCLWALWARLPPDTGWTERRISALLTGWHGFGDPAILRREMVSQGMVSRTPDCTSYRRIERRPPPEARALIRHLAQREERA